MPTASCTQVAGLEAPNEHRAMERYLFFAASALLQTTLSDSPETYAERRRRSGAVCVDMPYGTSIEDAVTAMAQSAGNSANTIESEARALLGRFLQPGADLAGLTQSLRPTEAELAMIFKPALLPAVTAYTDRVFNSGTVGPNTGQTELLVVPATTSDLIDGKPVLQEFPGGYEKLLPYLNRDIPIIRFKFVEPGETLGMAFDGLYKVGSRWVLIPKAWRAVPE
jgi:hypothetical protein